MGAHIIDFPSRESVDDAWEAYRRLRLKEQLRPALQDDPVHQALCRDAFERWLLMFRATGKRRAG